MAAPKTEYTPIVVFVLDFETGGRECQKCAVTQIALHAYRLDTFEKLGSYIRYVSPYNRKEVKGVKSARKTLKSKYEIAQEVPMEYEEDALTYSAIKIETLYNQGEPIEQVAEGALDFIRSVLPENTAKVRNKRSFIIGQNIWFDEGFLCQLFEYAGLMKELAKYVGGYTDFYGNWHPQVLDTIHLGKLALSHNPQVTSYKLELMCEHLGIELDDAHDADADVAATANVAGVLTQRMRSIGGEIDGGEIQMSKAEKSRPHFKI